MFYDMSKKVICKIMIFFKKVDLLFNRKCYILKSLSLYFTSYVIHFLDFISSLCSSWLLSTQWMMENNCNSLWNHKILALGWRKFIKTSMPKHSVQCIEIKVHLPESHYNVQLARSLELEYRCCLHRAYWWKYIDLVIINEKQALVGSAD